MKIPNPYCSFARYVKSYPRVSIVYNRRSSSDKLYRKTETSFFDPDLTPWDKMKISKPYFVFTRHIQSNPRESFVYSMMCRQRQ